MIIWFDHSHPNPQNGDTALVLAAQSGHAIVCTALLDQGAAVDLTSKVFERRCGIYRYLVCVSVYKVCVC